MRRTCVRRVCDSMANESGSSFTTDLEHQLCFDQSTIDQRPPMIIVMNKTDLARCRTTSWTEQTWKKIVGDFHRFLKTPGCQKGKDPACIHTWTSWSRLARRWFYWTHHRRCSPKRRRRHLEKRPRLWKVHLINLLRTASDEISFPCQSNLVVIW